MKNGLVKVLKVGLPVMSAGLALATAFMDKKELDETVTKKVTEALAKATKEEN